MSRRQQEELRAFALKIATEAAGRERMRCVWVCDRVLQQAKVGLDKKLMNVGEEQLAKVRLELTAAIIKSIKTLILAGAQPPTARLTPAPGQGEQPEPPKPEIIVP